MLIDIDIIDIINYTKYFLFWYVFSIIFIKEIRNL